jgi:hypothetical protein
MPMVKVTVFNCPHCHRTIPNGLNRDDYGNVICPGCSLPVRIASNEYEDSRQKNIFYICWTIAAIAIFLIVTISTYAEKHKFWDAVGFAILASAILTYIAGGLLGIIVVKLFPREFKK